MSDPELMEGERSDEARVKAYLEERAAARRRYARRVKIGGVVLLVALMCVPAVLLAPPIPDAWLEDVETLIAIGGGVIVLLVILLAAVGLLMGYLEKRALRKMPVRAIRDAPEGERIKIVGQVKSAETLTAPLSERPCVYYEIFVEDYQEYVGRDSHGEWRERAKERRSLPFALADESGEAELDLERAEVAIQAEEPYTLRFRAGDEVPAPVLAVFERYRIRPLVEGANPTTNPGPVSRRCIERVILERDRVAVIGHARREPGPASSAGGYREAPMRVVLEGDEEKPLLVTDDPALFG